MKWADRLSSLDLEVIEVANSVTTKSISCDSHVAGEPDHRVRVDDELPFEICLLALFLFFFVILDRHAVEIVVGVVIHEYFCTLITKQLW